jgi:hypothetical protein
MEEMFKVEPKRGNSKIFLAGGLIGVLLLGAVIWYLSLTPPMEVQIENILAGSYREGSPEYDELNKDIVISTDPKTVQSPTGLGTISMFIHGNIYNKGTRTIKALEVRAAVVTQFQDVLKERKILVVPVQKPELKPGETIPITLSIDGFKKDDDRADIRWKVTAIRAE